MKNTPLFITLALVIAGLMLWLLFGWIFVSDSSLDSPESLKKMAQLRNRSLAYLENQLPQDAIPLLQTLQTEFPEQPRFVLQNLSVAAVLQLEIENAAANPQQFASQIQQTRDWLSQLQQLSPDNVVHDLLLERLCKIEADTPARLAAAEQATRAAPTLPYAWFALYEAAEQAEPSPEHSQLVTTALTRVAQLEPANVWNLLLLLANQAQQQTPQIVDSLNQLQQILTPFATGIQQRSRVNPLETIETISTAVTSQDWPLVQRNVRLLGNILKPEQIAQSDRNELMPNTLEFIEFEFSPAIQQQLSELDTQIPAVIDVTFESINIPLRESEQTVLQCEIADLDLDGVNELVALTQTELICLARVSDITQWEIVHRMTIPAGTTRFVLADLDQDADAERPATIQGAPCALADLDLILVGKFGLRLFENQLGNAAEPATVWSETPFQAVPIAPENTIATLPAQQTVIPADFDLDGDLDLVCLSQSGAVSLWANHRDFQFIDTSKRSALPDPVGWHSGVAVDLDRDVDLDIVLLADDAIGYLENLRHGSLRWRPIESPADDVGSMNHLDLIDFNRDARWDLLIGGESGVAVGLRRPAAAGKISWDWSTTLPEKSCTNGLLWDYDNDGFLDLARFSVSTGEFELHRRSSPTQFASPNEAFSLPQDDARNQPASIDAADLDGDGDLDLVHNTGDSLQLLRNDGGNQHAHLNIALHGQQVKGGQAAASGRVNHYGRGSLIELKSGSHYQPRIANRQVTHFGLGPTPQANIVRVLWPNGIPQNVIDPKNNSFICEQQRLKGSCPYLYVWNGQRFEFYTDLLWAAPVGLQFAQGVIAPTRPWEYLLIDGTQLQPRGDRYELRITEELWEAAYFDQVELIAVDHPAEVKIYSNEKVGSVETPEFQIHAVTAPQQFQAATDASGNDILPLIANADGRYVKPFQTRLFQGVTEESMIELQFGDLTNAKSIQLLLTGWVFPSDTSINVALAQSETAPRPRPPYLQVPDEQGNWHTIAPSCGFPGGKTKTIVVDLTDKFLTDDYRLRLRTSMELYWDQIVYSVDPPVVPLTKTVLTLESAQLRRRGISAPIEPVGFGPERYDYHDVRDIEAWPAMTGPFTPFGDVVELLNKQDDRLAVIAAGDDIALQFRVPDQPLRPGWTRDFILHNVGYDKDADLNTVYGQSAAPYPTRTTATYPALPQTADDLRQPPAGPTRQLPTRRFWTQIRDTNMP